MSTRPVTVRDATLFFEKAPAALMVVDTTTLRIAAANERVRLFLGYAEDVLTRMPLGEILPPAELQRLVAVLLTNADTASIDNSRVARSGGAVREADFSVARLPSGNLVILAINDSSARGHLEDQLRQSEKMEALGMLAGGIAHDFNNLLTIISGYSQMLQTSYLSTDTDRTALNEVLKACEHAAGLTAQLLAFSRRQPVQPQSIDINRLLEQTAVLLRRLIGEQIDLRVNAEPDTGFIRADPGQIQQVILNLAINARDAMPEGGSLVIQTRRLPPSGARPGSYVLLEVSDTGSGMEESVRSRLFEPFFTTKPAGRGTGLGLATVSRIVKQFGGTIEVFSEAGHGATFRVYLPRAEDQAIEYKPDKAEAGGGYETILLVEDDPGVRAMTRAALERRGYKVIVAAGGAEALEVDRRHEGPISLVITDMVMPGMNGSALARLLMDRRPALAVIFISGYPDGALEDAPEGGGAPEGRDSLPGTASFLQKPFDPAVLAAKVREVLDRRKDVVAAGC
jgi:two-component system cell cycle sensor histidine kinase/response regulator CckA